MTLALEDMKALRERRSYEALSKQHQVFASHYAVNFKTVAAAEAAGLHEVTGSRLLQQPNICLAIAHLIRKKTELAHVDAGWVLKRLALLADFNIKRFVHVEDGRPYYDFGTATEDDWYCIDTLTVDALRGTMGTESRIAVDRVKLKPYDKLKALELVARHADVQAFEKRAEDAGSTRIATVRRVVVRPGDIAPTDAPEIHD